MLFTFSGAGSAATLHGHTVAGVALHVTHRAHFGRGAQPQSQSSNWAGYADYNSSYRTISGSWNVTSVRSSYGYASAWVGIGGYNSNDLIQAGTEMDSGGQYYAWYEMLPNYEIPLNYNVSPGDHITVVIAETSAGSGRFNIKITDSGNWSWNRTFNYGQSQNGSAEWVLEAPWIGSQSRLAHVGTVNFSNAYFTDFSGRHRTAQSDGPDRIVMVQGGGAVGTPLGFSGGGSAFAVRSYNGN
jgi:hypothetical protein